MNYKKFVKLFILCIGIFVIFNMIIWTFFTKKILGTNNDIITGDLARMSYLSKYTHERKNNISLSNKHIEAKDYNFETIDMITIGDSFFNALSGGENPYFQDFLATKKDLKILNLFDLPRSRNSIETVISLSNSGFLKKTKVKYIVIESVQRKIVNNFLVNYDYNKNISLDDINKYYNFSNKKTLKNLHYLPPTKFINNGNIKFIGYNLMYNFSDKAFVSKVYKTKLNKKLFSISTGTELLFFKNDLRSISKNTKSNLKQINDNFNKLSKFLERDGIKLIFMPAVNKYDLYSSFIINNKYPKDPFFEEFRKLNKNYIYIDTKKILLPELIKGRKDIYYIDDTHWSNKASDVISDDLLLKLR